MNAKILEIFRSVQGEGAYVGSKQVFIRFYECNMFCHWCDTPHSIGKLVQEKLKTAASRYEDLSLEDIIKRVDVLWGNSHSISLTGGEPLLQADFIGVLLPVLKERMYSVHIETNGTLPEDLRKVIGRIDIVAMDIKLPSSTRQRSFWEEHKLFLEIANQKEVFVKVVVTNDTDFEDVLKAVDIVKTVNRDILFILQPNFFEIKEGSVKKCVQLEEKVSTVLRNVRVIPQVHKILKVR